MRSIGTAMVVGALLLFAPTSSAAQGYLTVFVGGNFGGDSGVSLDQSIDDASKLSVGARLGTMGGGILGGEIDVGYTPNFYGKGMLFDGSSVLTVMGNVVIGVPAGPVRPFASLGIGLIRRTVSFAPGAAESGVTDSRVAYSLGGGVNFFIGSRVGLNADLRYFRNFSTGNAVLDLPDEHFNYARGSVGIVFRF